MIRHIYFYRLKCILRDKITLFWTLLFSILLGLLFNMAFSNLLSSELFSEIKIAVVDNAEYRENISFQEALSAVSSGFDSENSNLIKLFDVTYTSKEEADSLLKDGKITGYIYFDNGIKLVVKKTSGLYQTIIKSFLDDYKQTTATVHRIISEKSSNVNDSPSAIQKVFTNVINDVYDRVNYIEELTVGKASPNPIVHYFYTLIAMACLYGGFWGLKEVAAAQANLSAQAARVNLAPTSKLKVFFVSVLAAVTVQLSIIFILLLFLIFILKVDFGNQIGYIILTCIIGTFTGVTFGTFIASIVKKGEGMKIGVLIGASMTMSFLAGMMYANMKIIINTKVPILGYLNPANLLADAFYSLYFYDTYTRFFTNIILLCCLTAVFSLITYLVLRRQKYASI